MKIAIIQGVNLSEVGAREVGVYGTVSLLEYESKLAEKYPEVLSFFHSDIEGQLVQLIKESAQCHQGIIINPGAYTHTSVAIADALRLVALPSVEVHLSQVFAREPYRRKSYIAEVCDASISGAGLQGYELALQFLSQKINPDEDSSGLLL